MSREAVGITSKERADVINEYWYFIGDSVYLTWEYPRFAGYGCCIVFQTSTLRVS